MNELFIFHLIECRLCIQQYVYVHGMMLHTFTAGAALRRRGGHGGLQRGAAPAVRRVRAVLGPGGAGQAGHGRCARGARRNQAEQVGEFEFEHFLDVQTLRYSSCG